MGIRALLIGVLAAPALALAAPSVATVTIVDGGAVAIRESTKLALAEGVRLAKDDIVDTGAAGRLLRIEFTDGTLLDLGPDTRVLMSPRLAGDKARAAAPVHLLSGVAKISLPKGHAPATGALSSPAFDVTGLVRSAVFLVQPTEAYAFAEAGELSLQERLHERGASRADAIFTLKAGEFFAHAADAKAAVTPRPTPAFIQRLPRPFLDALPARAALFKDREIEPKRLGGIAYADVGAWLAADGLRAGFVTRWKALAQDPEFRKGLVANLRAHPEWDRTLFPEKYLPKPKADPAYGTKP